MPATPFRSARLIGAAAAAGITVVSWITPALSDSAAASTPATSTHASATAHFGRVRTHDAGDTFVSQAHPGARHGHASKLLASDTRRNRRVTYLRFDVNSVPEGASVTHAKLILTPKHRLVRTRL